VDSRGTVGVRVSAQMAPQASSQIPPPDREVNRASRSFIWLPFKQDPQEHGSEMSRSKLLDLQL
jgi:hypothetical protein